MNTQTGSQASNPQPEAKDDLVFGLPAEADSASVKKLTGALAQVETTLLAEREAWKEKEFLYIAALALLGSVIFFKLLDGSYLSIILVAIFECILLFGLAKRLGVDWAEQMYGWLVHLLGDRLKSVSGRRTPKRGRKKE